MPRPRRLLIVLGALAASIALALILYRPYSASRSLQAFTRGNAIMQAMVAYAQNFGDAFPPPDQAASLLVTHGLLSPDLLHIPGTPPGQPSFFLVAPAKPNTRWGNSVTEYSVVLYTNPAASRDGSIHAWGNDNFGGYLDSAAVAKLLPGLTPRSHPLK